MPRPNFTASLNSHNITVEPGALQITFHCTVCVLDNNGQVSQLPPGLDEFELYNVDDFKDNLPSDVVRKGGAFLSMYRK